jgi:hypothetical protein
VNREESYVPACGFIHALREANAYYSPVKKAILLDISSFNDIDNKIPAALSSPAYLISLPMRLPMPF